MEPVPGAFADAALPLPNSYWVLPARLLAGEHPVGATVEATRARFTALLEAGVNSFIDLTPEGEMPAYEAVLPLTVDYLRRPIRDHGLPAERVQMREILDHVRAALTAKKIVYLHCRAGIGRTNLVVGCLLVERGLSGAEALVELNRLWKQSARAAQWPAVPETPEQTEYVRNWPPVAVQADSLPDDPLLQPATLAAARGLRERFQGALLGLAVGDAVAAATQYRRRGRFTPVGDMLGGGPFDLPRGAWSDDTAMALCLAHSLLEREGFDARDQVERYRRWQREGYMSATGQCLGITASTTRALAKAQWRRQAFSGTHDPEAQDAEALSRVAPAVMYFFARDAVAVQQAAEAARTTCQAPRVLGACRALAVALHAALSGQPKVTILAGARSLPEPLGAGAAAASRTSATAALAAALDVFGSTYTFRDAVLAAANLGGNSDVVAGATGALAGAHYTAGAIPTLWRNSLMKKQMLEECADRLLAHAMLELAG